MALNNPGFESGNTVGWTITANGARPVATTSVVTTSGYVDTGTYAVEIKGGPGGEQGAVLVNTWKPLIKPNSQVSVSAKVRSVGGVKGDAFSWVGVRFYNANGTYTDQLSRMLATNEMRGGYVNLAITATAPAGAMYASMLLQGNVNGDNRRVYFDTCSMTVEEAASVVTLTYPVNGTTYEADMEIPLRVKVADGFTLTSLEYKVTNTLTAVTTSHTPTNPDWSMLISGLAAGTYTAQATGVIDGNNLLSNVNSFTVGAAPPKTTREFKASNSFTQLILSKIESVAQEVPSIAVVNGCEIEVAYSLEILARTLDKDVVKEAADPDMVFNLLNEGVLEVSLLQAQNDGSYSTLGGTEVVGLPINRADFEAEETGTSGDFAWNHFVHAASPTTVVIGGDEGLFGLTDMAITDFLDTSMGFRFYPSLRGIPEGSDSGEVCVRIRLDQVKVSVFFDAGSVEYYFATPDGEGGYSEVIKGTLISANVLEGSLRNGDGAGAMQLAPLLQDMDSGSAQWPEIKAGSTIHSAYYPTPKNQIGVVDEDMRYNGLPIKQALDDSRTKSQFITANFYGDERMDSMYGVNGVDRAFSYNGEYFYKIYTQADADKDQPRHVAYHHTHLALGYKEGRVDVSVAGEPWNFSGLDGASSWGIGDSVTGMIPLSGTVLGIFCDNSVVGLSGTTVDNFATQVISPRMGALEYTVVDMGYPVYANSYGIYTLNQTQQYGDFLGNPLSQDISTWIRPRLNTDPTAPASVNMAYPVRSKNQYRLSFTDNHILTMTMNYGQQSAPTFSLHNYGMTPTAVSSQLDQNGREKLHFTASPSAPPVPPGPPMDEGVRWWTMNTEASLNGRPVTTEYAQSEGTFFVSSGTTSGYEIVNVDSGQTSTSSLPEEAYEHSVCVYTTDGPFNYRAVTKNGKNLLCLDGNWIPDSAYEEEPEIGEVYSASLGTGDIIAPVVVSETGAVWISEKVSDDPYVIKYRKLTDPVPFSSGKKGHLIPVYNTGAGDPYIILTTGDYRDNVYVCSNPYTLGAYFQKIANAGIYSDVNGFDWCKFYSYAGKLAVDHHNNVDLLRSTEIEVGGYVQIDWTACRSQSTADITRVYVGVTDESGAKRQFLYDGIDLTEVSTPDGSEWPSSHNPTFRYYEWFNGATINVPHNMITDDTSSWFFTGRNPDEE